NSFDFLVENSTKSKQFTLITLIVTIIALSFTILGFFLHYIIGVMGALLGLGMVTLSIGYNSGTKRFSKRSGLTNRHY
ncbi:MAG TPA: hypothetical protein VKO63_09010, partial [Chitinispirillaceae bacterium]|nr:hypothetical protein [Chitinispirillaceae bacterium]